MPEATAPPDPSAPLSLTWAERLIRDAQIPGLAAAPALETSAFCRLQAAWRLERGFEVRLRVEACRSAGEESYDVDVSWPSGGGEAQQAAAQAELCCRVAQLGRLITERLRVQLRGGGQP